MQKYNVKAIFILCLFVGLATVIVCLGGCRLKHLWLNRGTKDRHNMLDRHILNRIRSGVCAIGYLKVKPVKGKIEEYINNRDNFVIIGTGFLIRKTTVVTNRHVLQELKLKQDELGFSDDQKLLKFVYPAGEGEWQEAFCRFKFAGILANQEIDVGFIEFTRRPDLQFEQCVPLELGNPLLVNTGQSIGVFGYPHGTGLLKIQDEKHRELFNRFGPVLQQGYISAIAPLDDVSTVDNFLLDINYAGGMSGSPVFRIDDGLVVGLFYAGLGISAFAIPIDADKINEWLKLHDQHGKS